jgi:hypothetical protein
MNKQESQNLMIGSWVLAGGEPRQVSSLTTKKAGFKRGTSGHRDFFRFDQLQGIPLSEELLKECIKVVPPKESVSKIEKIVYYDNSKSIIFVEKNFGGGLRNMEYIHNMQAYLLSHYGYTIVFDIEKYKFLQQPEIVIPNEIVDELMKYNPTMKNVPDAIVDGDTLVKRLDSVSKSRHLTYTKE